MAITTNPLDALLAIRNGFVSARWNFPDATGSPVSAPAGLGNPASLSYSFLAAAPAYATAHGDGAGFLAFDALQQQATRQVLASIEQVANVHFAEVTGVGQMTFANSSQSPGQGGYAYYPSYQYSWSLPSNTIVSATALDTSGDVWINRNAGWTSASWAPGGYGYTTLLHEIGHALGLKHPFEGTNTLDAAFDNTRFTVMSYTDAPDSAIVSVTGSATSYSWTTSHVSPSSLMVMDVQALQALYGANLASHAGNDTYRWGTNQELLETIWDGGGTDTIDCSNQVLACEIDLNDNAYSSIGLRQTDAEQRLGLDLPSWFTQPLPADVYKGKANLGIALNTVIENAVGGSGNDRLLGNEVANNLAGGAGNDTLTGGLGNDVLDGGTGADRMEGGAGNDAFYVDNTGDLVVEGVGAGTDIVYSSRTSLTLGANVENGSVVAPGSANLTGNALNNTLFAGTGNNVLAGGLGIDTLSYANATAAVVVDLASSLAQNTGGSGVDTLSGFENLVGSAFGDKLSGDAAANTLNGGAGADTVLYTAVASAVIVSLATATGTASGGGGNDLLIGIENITGSAFADQLTGSGAANVLTGGAGDDTLSGGAGVDRLVGGAGQDRLSGGLGRDIFDFDAVTETGLTALTRDIVLDFLPGQDRLDLSTIDADMVAVGNSAFSFIGAAAFGANATGQVRYEFDAASGVGVVSGSNDADTAAEFTIELTGVTALATTDFLL
jgi:Ca2+-binding RTX toxin-like protein